jgi:hypothetical protein
MAGIGTPAIPSSSGGGSSTITTFLGSTTSGPVNVTQVGGSSFALGQALGTASLPVVLTAAQISTLTPLSTIAVTQSGTWDEVGINDSGNSITVDNATASNFNAQVAGDVAAGGTDSGNPVKVGGINNTTLPTLTNGQRGDLQLSTRGSVYTTLAVNNSTTVITSRADNADGVVVSATANNLGVQSRNTIFNGTSWDRTATILNATNSVGTGIAAAGILAQFDDTSPTVITENQFGNLRMSNNRNLYNTIRDAAGNERGLNIDANGEIGIGAIRTSITPGTAAANLGKAEDAAHNSGDTGVFSLAVANEAQTALAADGDYIGHAVDTKGNTLAVGNIAHDSVDAGAPIKIGGKARTAPPTAVAASDRVDAQYDIYGKQIVRESLREDLGNQQTQISSSTSETTIVTADATYKLDVYALIITNTSATGSKVTIKDSTTGTTRFVFYVPATETRGFSVSPSGAHKQNAANNNWTATCGTSVAAIEISALWTRSL